MNKLLGINRDGQHFIAYNPHDQETMNASSNSYKVGDESSYEVPSKTFAVGTGSELAIAKFNGLHIGGGFNGTAPDSFSGSGTGAGLTITSDGKIYTNGTITQQTTGSSRISYPSNKLVNQHSILSENIDYSLDSNGKIVISTNGYNNVDSLSQNSINNITFNESLPIVEYSNNVNDKRVFGVIVGKSDKRLTVKSNGEGKIKVNDINGKLEYGDFITTSDIQGIGMKQNENYMTNYTVAKVLENCEFNDSMYVQENGSRITKDQYELLKMDNKKVGKMKVVKCTFVCGV